MYCVHDNELITYLVNLKDSRIILFTLCKYSGILQEKQLIFSGVLTHYFENELSGSILFDVEKSDIPTFIQDNLRLLAERKGKCWPMYYENIKDLANQLNEEGYNYFVISSSYGLSGWILAKEIQSN